MDVMKKHTGQIILSIFIAIIGVVCGVLPYFAVANIVTEIANGSTGFMVFSKQIMIILFGLVGTVGSVHSYADWNGMRCGGATILRIDSFDGNVRR